MSERVVSFTIDTEVTSAYLDDLLKFVHQHYILPLREHFTDVNRTAVDHEPVLTFTTLGPKGKYPIDVEMRSGRPIQVKMTPSDETVPQTALDQLREDLIISVQLFEGKVRTTTLYFAWVEGEEAIPEKAPRIRRSLIYRMFKESMLLLFILFIAASILVFIVFPLSYAPIVLVAFQFIMVLMSDKIIARIGDWSVTARNPNVHLLQYHLPIEEHKEFRQKYTRDLLIKIKNEIHEKTLAIGKPVDCETADEVLSKYGFKCVPENLSTKTINVYEIVKSAAEKFSLSIPKVVISNTILPNAAASGSSPGRGIILMTTGLLVQLNDEEILSVVGHEFSHLKARDPIVLFGLIAAEYLLRIYVFWPFIMYFGLLYLFFALGIIYFIAKFLEARADLESAIKIGQPRVLAEALRKIGYRKLQFERASAHRIQGWINWNPHPPIYFRVSRLEKLQSPEKVKHPLMRSIMDNIRGFFAALH